MIIRIRLPSCPLFEGIAPEALLEELARLQAAERKYKAGETLLAAGSPTSRMGLVLEGELHAILPLPQGRQLLQSRLLRGELFGQLLALDGEREKYYIDLMTKEGNKEAKEKLIEHNLRLVVYIAKKFDNTKVGAEDLISIGTIGLMKAINTFDATKSIKLATYASRCIENEILMYLRKNSKQKFEVSIDEPLNVDWDGNELLLSDILGTDEDIIYKDLETQADLKVLNQALKTLNGREKMIIELRFGLHSKDGEELTQKQVADLLGISQSYISRLEKKIMKRLNREMLKQD